MIDNGQRTKLKWAARFFTIIIPLALIAWGIMKRPVLGTAMATVLIVAGIIVAFGMMVWLAYAGWNKLARFAWTTPKQQTGGQVADVAEADKLLDERQTKQRSWLGGRPRYPENKWAYQQVNELGRKPEEVYPEWKQRAGDRLALRDSMPEELFRKAIKPKK